MMKQRERLGGEVGGAVFATILCIALGFGLWLGLCGMPAKTQQSKQGESPENKMANHETPFYCSLEKSLSKEEREYKKQLTQKMESARVETKELANGYAFRFRPESVSLGEVADWVATERRCCPFFDMAIELEREGGPMWLKITGREGVKQFIRMGFTLLKLR